jgi:hypothetical protein
VIKNIIKYFLVHRKYQFLTVFSLSLFVLFIPMASIAQNSGTVYKIFGTIVDSAGKNPLAGATVVEKITNRGINSNAQGYFEILLKEGSRELTFSYIGYKTLSIVVNANSNQQIDVYLAPEPVHVKEVVIDTRQTERHIQNIQAGTVELNKKDVANLPLLLGESDFYKALQLMPGVQTSGEGNAAIYVRGGGYDQNLILLDEATVYNPTHLLGFYSVFNTDIISNVTMFKSGMPAEYGNRISSVLDFNTKSKIPEKVTTNGSIGLISTRINIDIPVFKQKAAIFIAGRKTYVNSLLDIFRKTSLIKHSSILYKSGYDFYDLNGSIVFKLSRKDKIMLSSYMGDDLFELNSDAISLHTNMDWGNKVASLSWNHTFNENLYMDSHIVYSDYGLKMAFNQNQFSFHLNSNINDIGFKNRITYLVKNNKLRAGLALIHHNIVPNSSQGTSDSIQLYFGTTNHYYSYEASLFLSDEIKINEKLSIIAGLRYNSFYHIGPFNNFLRNDTIYYGKGKVIKNYNGMDYRFSARYLLSNDASIKFAFNYNNQYVHLVNASSVTFPTDFWIPSSKLIQPQKGNQWTAGFYRNLKKFNIETSVEIYYKTFHNQLEFYNGFLNSVDNTPLDESLIFGKGRAYGAEFFVRKSTGKLTGWIGYTISKTEKSFDDIENGNWFPAKYDRPLDISVVTNYEFNSRWTFSVVFVYAYGSAYTPVVGRYFVAGNVINQYGKYNSARMPAYHRLDISASHILRKTEKTDLRLVFSVYNVYNRHNPFFVYPEVTGDITRYTLRVEPKEVSIFPVLPSISWQFSF